MARLAFTSVLNRLTISDTELDSMFSDIGNYINAKLSRDVFESSCVEYRHFKEPPTFFLADKDEGAAAIGASVAGAGWGALNTHIDFEPTYAGANAIYVEAWFYGYDYLQDTRLGIAKWNGAAYTYEGETRICVGCGRDDTLSWGPYSVSGATGGLQDHYLTGVAASWAPPSAGRFLIMTSCVFGPKGLSAAFGFERYNAMMWVVGGGKVTGEFDSCYMFAYAKDVD